ATPLAQSLLPRLVFACTPDPPAPRERIARGPHFRRLEPRMTQCPMCRRDLPAGAVVCPHCQRDLNVGPWTIGFVLIWLVLAASAAVSYRQAAQLVSTSGLVEQKHPV